MPHEETSTASGRNKSIDPKGRTKNMLVLLEHFDTRRKTFGNRHSDVEGFLSTLLQDIYLLYHLWTVKLNTIVIPVRGMFHASIAGFGTDHLLPRAVSRGFKVPKVTTIQTKQSKHFADSLTD